MVPSVPVQGASKTGQTMSSAAHSTISNVLQDELSERYGISLALTGILNDLLGNSILQRIIMTVKLQSDAQMIIRQRHRLGCVGVERGVLSEDPSEGHPRALGYQRLIELQVQPIYRYTTLMSSTTALDAEDQYLQPVSDQQRST